MKKTLPWIILLSALSVSASAAFYSVYGLSKLFSSASTEVIIMASSLEISKLVIATLLHEYWNTLSKLLRFYLTLAVFVLVMITSAGIYGFLSSAYQETASTDSITTRKVELIDIKLDIFETSKTELSTEKNLVVSSITELRTALSNPNTVQYIDKETGQLITTTSSSARKSLETQLQDAISNRQDVDRRIQVLNDTITNLEISKIELLNSSESVSELGPLKYISGISGLPMDRVVNYFLLLIIFVFDPLAISLVLAANFAFKQIPKRPKVGRPRTKDKKQTKQESKPVSEKFKDIVDKSFEKLSKKKSKK